VVENTVIPPRSIYMGVPAKLQREVTADDQAFVRRHATNYLQYKVQYLAKEVRTLTQALGEPGKPQG
jgi:carbonic anhydrase/acetyltransferase-like protein (isoleucine patch superfamily)